MKTHLLGIDVGTYSSKAVLTDLDGNVLHTAVTPHGLSMPQPGHAEQDADQIWWADVCKLSRQMLAESGVRSDQIAAMAVSAIGPCLLPLDAAMRPLRPAILYGIDVRSSVEIKELEKELGAQAIADFSLMGLTSQAIGPKIRWLQKYEPEVWQATAKLTSATAYLVFRLTGLHRMDRHSASHFMPLFNPRSGEWDARYASAIAPLAWLPELGWAEEMAGPLHAEAATATGLTEGTPVAFGTIDALSEAISVGVVKPGDLMLMYGSTTFFVLVQDRPTPDTRVWSVCGAQAGQFNLAAGMSTTGGLTRWFKDEFARDLDADTAYASLFESAAEVRAGSEGLLVLPYFSGERTPINDTQASGVIAGLNLSHTRAQIFRAVLEGVGFGVRHNLETFADIGAEVRRMVAVGGGAQTQTWLQIVSDITGVTQVLPQVTVGAAYGDAFLAGRAAGLLQQQDIHRWVRVEREIAPQIQNRLIYDAMYAEYLCLYLGSKDVMHRLKAITAGHFSPVSV
jgi:xylulokinase